jgi:hypothetical protein
VGFFRRIRDALLGARARPPDPVEQVRREGRRPLYVFFDEAGDLDFGRFGTSYFLCGILVTYDPWPLMQALGDLREEVFRGAFIQRAFHAAEDKQAVRDRVFETICGVGGFDAHIFVTQKVDVPTPYKDPPRFYTFMADFALRMVLERHPNDEPIFVVTDELPLNSKREAVVKGLKTSLAALLPGREFRIEHHSSGTQACLQAIDYLTWAVFRRLERTDDRSYVLIRTYIVQEVQLDWRLVQRG